MTYGVPCIDKEMHEEEKEDTNVGALEEKKPSLIPTVGAPLFRLEELLCSVKRFPHIN